MCDPKSKLKYNYVRDPLKISIKSVLHSHSRQIEVLGNIFMCIRKLISQTSYISLNKIAWTFYYDTVHRETKKIVFSDWKIGFRTSFFSFLSISSPWISIQGINDYSRDVEFCLLYKLIGFTKSWNCMYFLDTSKKLKTKRSPPDLSCDTVSTLCCRLERR